MSEAKDGGLHFFEHFGRHPREQAAPRQNLSQTEQKNDVPYTELDKAEERQLDIQAEIRDKVYQLEKLGDNVSVDEPVNKKNENNKTRLRRVDWKKVEYLFSALDAVPETERTEEDNKALELLKELKFLEQHSLDEKRLLGKETDPLKLLLEQGEIRSDVSAEQKELYDRLKKALFDSKTGKERTWSELPKLGNDRYGVLKDLGQGGMGGVKLVWDSHLMNFAVIKEMLPDIKKDPGLVLRFKREIVDLDAVNSDYVIKPIDVVQISDQEGDLGIVMKFVAGQDLFGTIHNNNFDRTDISALDKFTAKTLIKIGLGLRDIHKLGIIHRDLKPQNVMLTPTGLKVLDFGIAGVDPNIAKIDQLDEYVQGRGTDNETHTQGLAENITLFGSTVGTPLYSSPENLMGRDISNPRSDLYSFGTIGYEILTGHTPVGYYRENSKTPKTAQEIMDEKLLEEIKEPYLHRNDLEPSAIEPVIMRLLKANAKERPATAQKAIELLAGATLFDHPDVQKDEDFMYLVQQIGKSPAELQSDYEAWIRQVAFGENSEEAYSKAA